MLHEEFFEWMKQVRKDDGRLTDALKRFVMKLKAWNKTTFENIFQRKKRNEMRLTGMKRALDRKLTKSLLRLEERLKKERQLMLLKEELLWKQKLRQDWLKSGDGNIKYFHTSTFIRRRHNKVESC